MSAEAHNLTYMQQKVVEMLDEHMQKLVDDPRLPADVHENAKSVQTLLATTPHARSEILDGLSKLRFVGADEEGNPTDPIKMLMNIYVDTRAFGV